MSRRSKALAVKAVRGVAGFTLIELLLATGLVAMIMLMAYSGLEASIKLADSGDEYIERSSRVRITHEFLRRQLSRMMPLSIAVEEGRNYSFVGDAERLMWVGPMPGYLGRGGPYVQELYLERAGDGGVLNYRFAMLNGYEPGDLEEQEPVALVEQIDRASFQFKSVDTSGRVTAWNSDWDNKAGIPLPLMVRVDIKMRPEARMDIPSLVTPVIVDMNVGRPGVRFNQ
jgi:general secretion pathway protein J